MIYGQPVVVLRQRYITAKVEISNRCARNAAASVRLRQALASDEKSGNESI